MIKYNQTTIKGVSHLLTIKMNVQSAYHGELLREGKIYDIDETTANRWISSKIATLVNNKTEKN